MTVSLWVIIVISRSGGECYNKERPTKERAEGLIEGRNQANLETAKKLLNKNISIDIISRTTGLSEKTINA